MIDMATFDQILEMDDDDDKEFSRAIVTGFLEQAHETFEKMEESLTDKDLSALSSLGHFLKGSSATLGLINVKDYCEKIQHFGSQKDETGLRDLEEDECLESIKDSLKQMRVEFDRAERYFKKLYPGDE
ncbi:signal transduction histidine kinase [Pyronema domesticum]|nr:signal transduction histidine kinase [Pyronema domesticum]